MPQLILKIQRKVSASTGAVLHNISISELDAMPAQTRIQGITVLHKWAFTCPCLKCGQPPQQQLCVVPQGTDDTGHRNAASIVAA